MLAAEAGLFVLLSGVFKTAKSAPQLRQGVLRAVISGRMQARTVASAAAKAQIEAAGIQVFGELAPATAYEVARATSIADNAAALWRGHQADALAEGLDVQAATVTAGKRSAWKASQVATTEVSETWSHEAGRMAAAANQQGAQLWLVWDAVLDGGTCAICAGNHGKAVPADVGFPDGSPGGMHPGCRCQAIVVTKRQVDPTVAEQGARGPDAIQVHDEPPKSGPRPVAKPAATPTPEPAAKPRHLRIVRPTIDYSDAPEITASVLRPRRIESMPLPDAFGAKRANDGRYVRQKPKTAATFRPTRPPTKQEVSERKRAKRAAEHRAAKEAADQRRAAARKRREREQAAQELLQNFPAW